MYKIRQCALALICCGAAITGCALAGGTPKAPPIHFLGRTYHLASFDKKDKPTWDFVSGSETMDDWTTMLTIIDRPDARSSKDLDRVVEENKSNYESHGGRILVATTLPYADGTYNYTVVGFDEPSKQRFEISFVKAAMGRRNAQVAVYRVRISDPQDYTGKAKTFLHQHSAEVGSALGQLDLPDIDRLPRTEF
jgi:hypothetical protein